MDYSQVVIKIKKSIAKIAVMDSQNNIIGTGSGFIFGKKGVLLTCNHVVNNASSIFIIFLESEYIPATKIISDKEHDLALLKFDDNDRKPLEKLDTKFIVEGMPVIFSGYPLSMSTLTTHRGMLSSIAKDTSGVVTYIIDGTVNPGNSGCPLLSEEGKVLGIVNATRREQSTLLSRVEKMTTGALSMNGVDLVEIYKALIKNLQLGIGYAVPVSYVPEHKSNEDVLPTEDSKPSVTKVSKLK